MNQTLDQAICLHSLKRDDHQLIQNPDPKLHLHAHPKTGEPTFSRSTEVCIACGTIVLEEVRA